MPKDKFSPGPGSKPSSYADYPVQADEQFGAAVPIMPSYSDFLENMPLSDQGQLLAMKNAVEYDMRPPLPTIDDAEPWEMGPVEDAVPPQELGMTDADAETELEAMQNEEKPKKKPKAKTKKKAKSGSSGSSYAPTGSSGGYGGGARRGSR